MSLLAAPVETEYTSCALCGKDEPEQLHLGQDRAYGRPGQFPIVRCRNCDLVYVNPRPVLDAIGYYYPTNYEPYRKAPEEARFKIQQLHQRLKLRGRCLAVTRVRRQGRLLDVGCATGTFLAEMRRYGDWQVCGVEPNQWAARYAQERLGLDVFHGHLSEASFPDGRFDVVTMWDVLEHLHDPRQTLAEIFRILKPDGFLICSVPNLDSIDAKLFGRFWIGLDVPRHLYVYSKHTLSAMLRAEGLQPRKFFCFYGRYTAFALSLRLVLREWVRSERARKWLDRILFVPVWRFLFLPYFYIIDELGKGVIVTVYAQKVEATSKAHLRCI
jgi:2-polyprenyl-3-methyl-5-hydroxy-6-metoxy-1,4-benzoquinol methylase